MYAQQRVTAARWGWVLICLAVVGVSVWVVGKGLSADTPDGFSRWAGWANILALPVAALGIVLVLIDSSRSAKAGGRGVARTQTPSVVQRVTTKAGNVQAAVNGNIINYPGPPSAFAPDIPDHARSPERSPNPEPHE